MENLWFLINQSFHKLSGWKDERLFKILIQNSKYLLSGSLITTLFGFIRTALTTRALGLELFGVLTIIVSYVEVIVNATKFMPWQALIKFGSVSVEDHDKAAFMGYVKQSILLDGVSALLGFSITNALIGVFTDFFGLSMAMRGNIALYSLVAFLDFTGTPMGVLRLLNKFHYFMIQEFITSTLGVLGAAFVFISGGDIYELIIIIVVSKLVGSIYIVLITALELRKGGFLRYWQVPFRNWRSFAKFTLWNYLTHIIAVPTKQLDLIIVSTVVTIEAAGIYKIIKQVAGVIGLLVNPVYYAIYPQFSNLIAQGKQGTVYKFAAKSGIFSLFLVSPIAFLLSVSSPWWLGAVFGTQFATGWIPLTVFLLVKVFEFSCNPIHPLFIAMGFVKQESMISLLSSAIYLLAAWHLGLNFDLIGVIIAHGISTMVLVLGKLLTLKIHAQQGLRAHP